MQLKSLLILAVLLAIGACLAEAAVNPWTFSGRSSLWAPLINATTVPQMGSEIKSNWFWGFDLQFLWQFKTGRLFNNGDTISPDSWWAGMNYYLTLPPYFAAAEVGLVPEETILPPSKNANKFCTTADSCDSLLMSHWSLVMESIQEIQQGKSTMSEDELVQILRDAHTFTINWSIEHFGSEVDKLAGQEWRFSHGWALFVEVIASTHFLTNYTNMVETQVFLPPRMLTATDIPPFIGDMSAGTNAMVGSMMAVHLLDKVGGFQPLLSLWQNAMESARCRALGRYAISNFLLHPVDSVIEVVKGVISSCTKFEPSVMQKLKHIQVPRDVDYDAMRSTIKKL